MKNNGEMQIMKTVLLTGATGDIGEAILAKFTAEKYNVIAPTRQTLDLECMNSLNEFITHISPSIDVYVHCAGFNQPKSVYELTEADIQKTFQINALSFYSISKALAEQFRQKKHGAIIGISSLYGHFSRKKRLAYSASKHDLNAMIKTLALELGQYNVKVNGVSPGFVDTKMTRKNNSDSVIEGFKQKIPLGRLALPSEIAEVVYFLASSENYIHGQSLIVDGGYSVGGFQE